MKKVDDIIPYVTMGALLGHIWAHSEITAIFTPSDAAYAAGLALMVAMVWIMAIITK